jgi:hypothetical protein
MPIYKVSATEESDDDLPLDKLRKKDQGMHGLYESNDSDFNHNF